MTKSKKLLVWILAALVLLAGVAAALVLTLGSGGAGAGQTTAETDAPGDALPVKLYWNVEKESYSGSNITRAPRGDGYYYVRFSVDGEQVDIPAADYLTTRYIDTLEVMGLELDEQGVISRVLRVEECVGRILMEDYYVEELSDTSIKCNSVGTGTGHSMTVSISPETKIYRVNTAGDVLCGMPGELQVGSQILAVADYEGNVTHIYGRDPFQVGDVYWNVSRQYDSDTKLTTRTPNALGLYEYVFAVNGEQVTLYTRDIKIASKIDSVAAKCMGLVFDEEGYITDTLTTKSVTGAASFGSWYHAVEIDGQVVNATKLTQGNNFGNTARGTMAPDCKVYDVSGQGAYVGEPTQLRKYDQIHGLRNSYGQIIIIFVVGRSQEVDVYWNVERQWNSTSQTTSRIPNSQGYYELLLAVNGQQQTLRTKDKTLVDAIDAIATKCFGLKVEGNEILAVYPTSQVWGGRQFCSWDDVTSIYDGTVTAKEMDEKKTPQDYVGPMAKDCKVYDVTGYIHAVGTYTTLQVGDKIHALKDHSGNITHIFVVDRAIDAKIYYNVSRKWDSETASTTRTPNGDGYYEIVFAVDGQQKTLRTKDKALVDKIDGAAARCVGLWVNGDEITHVFASNKVAGGIQFCSYDIVTEITPEGKVTAQEADASKGDKTYIGVMAKDCVVYDMTGQVDFVGAATTLQVGDKIHALKDKKGNITYIYVVGRSLEAPFAWNVSRMWDSKTATTTRTPNAKGYYEIVLAVNGQQKTYKTKDLALVNAVDGTATRCFGIWARGDILTNVFKTTDVVGGLQFCSYDIVTEITKDGKVTAQEADASKGEQTYTGVMAEDCGVYDVTGQVDFVGAATTLQVGDKIHALKDGSGNITCIYVVGRSLEAPFAWNVSRMWDSKTASTTRTPNAKGYYEIVLAVDGQQKTYKTKDLALVNAVDGTATRCFGIWAQGDILTNVFKTTDVVGGLQFCSYDFVTEITAQGQLTAQEADASKGEQIYTGVMAEDCGVYDVTGQSAFIGAETTLQVGDKIHALKDSNGTVTCGYVVGRSATIGWNVSRMWDSKSSSTSRIPYADGYYEIVLAVDGQQKTYKTKDLALVNQIDEPTLRCFGFHAQGDVLLQVFPTSKAMEGLQFCSYDFVTEITAQGQVTAQEADADKGEQTYTGLMTQTCGVYDVTGQSAFVGAATTLQVGDKIHALKDGSGNITYIYVVGRSATIGWNVDRQWDSTAKTTKRTPNDEGYYEIVLAVDGQQKTYKTKELALVNQIDEPTLRCFGFHAQEDVLVQVFPTSKAMEGLQFCSYDFVTEITAQGQVTAQEADADKGEQTYTGLMTQTCGVYDMTGQSAFIGAATTLQVGDKIHALKNDSGNITYIYVVGRSATIGWNVDRQWDSTAKTTKRTPNDEGYYEIVLAVDGQQKTYKTKELALVNKIDESSLRCFGFHAQEDVLVQVFPTSKAMEGLQFCSYDEVTEITAQGQVTAQESDASKGEQTYIGVMAENCGVYDVTGQVDFVGAETVLKTGYKIHALKNDQDEITYIFVVERQEKKTAYCSICDETVTWYSWDGSAALEADQHYFLCNDINQNKTAYIGTADEPVGTVTLDLCGYDIQASQRAFRIYGTLNLLDSGTDGTIYGNATGQATGFYVYDAGTFNMYGGTFRGSSQPNTQSGIGAVGLSSGSQAVFNMYGGCLADGNTKKDGGNLALYQSGTFNMYGGTIQGGTTQTNGGSISMGPNSVINLYGGTIGMGQADGKGNCVNAQGTVNLYSGKPIQVAQLRLEDKKLTIQGTLTEGSSIGVTLASGQGIFSTETAVENLPFFIAEGENTVLYKEDCLAIEVPEKPHSHCVCGGLGQTGDHTSCDDLAWTELTQGMLDTPDGTVVIADAVSGNVTGIALASGNYYLSGDLSLVSFVIPTGTDIRLCLNGHDITCTDRAFQIDGTLTLTDCQQTQGAVTTSKVRQGPVFYVRDGGVFNLYGGRLLGTKKVSSDGGVGVIGLNANGGAVMNMYAGTVSGGMTSKNGGNICLYHDSVLNLYGGTVSNGTADQNGGNLSMTGTSTVKMHGGSITGGVAASGGNVLLNEKGTSFKLYAGTLTGTEISGAGANVRISAGTLYMYGGTVENGTTQNGNGGNIFITGDNSAMVMTGGTVSGGTANSGAQSRHGGNIYVASGSKLTIQDDQDVDGDPVIRDGTSGANHGGNIYYGGKEMLLSGVQITGGTAAKNGDNVYVAANGVTVSECVICNDAGKENLTIAKDKTVTVDTLTARSNIGITALGTGAFGTCTDTGAVQYLQADDETKSIVLDGTSLTVE